MKTEKIPFNDENRAEIIAKQAALGYRLVEEQRHLDGNWLIFTNEPEPPELPRDLPGEIDNLKARVEKLERR